MSDQLVSIKHAAKILGVNPATLRVWSDEGRFPHTRINERGDRRYSVKALEDYVARARGKQDTKTPTTPRVALYTRVSGRSGQETSLEAQETELRQLAKLNDTVIANVYHDHASGLAEHRPGLDRMIKAAQRGEFEYVWVTHADRLARFGVPWLEQVFEAAGVRVRVVHDTPHGDAQTELVNDFVALIASFSGRLYGQRSAEARRRLLAAAEASAETPEDEAS